jgi:hypothetical protein
MSIFKRITVEDYYDRYAHEGRAVIRGSMQSPRAWIARLDGQYILCLENIIGTRVVEPDTSVRMLQVGVARIAGVRQ